VVSKARGALLLVFCLVSASGRQAAAEPLSPRVISRVIESRRLAVRHTCWEPALEMRRAGGTVTARVQASFVIASSGKVESITATGAEQTFPGLSICIAASIQRWKFPSSDKPTPIKMPFLFVGQ
jgi:hypothetical protein